MTIKKHYLGTLQKFMKERNWSNATLVSIGFLALLKYASVGLIWKGEAGCFCKFFRQFLAHKAVFSFSFDTNYYFLKTFNVFSYSKKLKWKLSFISWRTSQKLVCSTLFLIRYFSFNEKVFLETKNIFVLREYPPWNHLMFP